MTETQSCPQCQAPIPADAPGGICPKCLMNAGLDSSDGMQATTMASGFVPPTPEELAPHFPQLEILELLGKGGMGAVYKARQPGLDRFVAVKILPPEVGTDPAFAERFTREARTLGKLSHQNIVAIFDSGQTGDLYYFLMEFIDGANLRQIIQSGGIQPEQALAIVPQICDALQFAHDAGVVHRDIKPENILVDKQGQVKIADFGLAKLIGQAPAEFTLTGTNQVMGTLHYIAPEQMAGSRGVDHRADIYSLGVVFYEMLTGALPMGRFEPPSKKVQVDVRLDEVVLRALENEPQRRYQQAGDVKTAVDIISNRASPDASTPTTTRKHSISQESVTVSSMWRRLTMLPARLTGEIVLLWILGWVITGIGWNFGPWGLFAGGIGMTCVGYGVAMRARQALNIAVAAPPSRWARCWVDSNDIVGLLFGWFLLVAATVNSWTLFVDLSMLDGDPAVFLQRYEQQEHRLIRQLSEFENDVPDVEFATRNFRFNPIATTMPGVWSLIFVLGGIVSIASAFRGRLQGTHSGFASPFWRPIFAIAVLMFATLWLAQMGSQFVSLFHDGSINASTGQTQLTVRAEAKNDAVMETINEWLQQHDFHQRFLNSWNLETVPTGKRVAKVDRLGYVQGWFDRWAVRWTGPQQRSPALEIVVLSSESQDESAVRIHTSMGRKDQQTISDWQPMLDDLKAAIKSSSAAPSTATD